MTLISFFKYKILDYLITTCLIYDFNSRKHHRKCIGPMDRFISYQAIVKNYRKKTSVVRLARKQRCTAFCARVLNFTNHF